jgi:hypothetical protein
VVGGARVATEREGLKLRKGGSGAKFAERLHKFIPGIYQGSREPRALPPLDGPRAHQRVPRTEDVDQSKSVIEVKADQIGAILINLESTRELLGHKTLASTLIYTNGLDGVPEFDFVKHIILRESGKGGL